MKKLFLSTIVAMSLFSGVGSAYEYQIADMQKNKYIVELHENATALDLRIAIAAQKNIAIERVILAGISDDMPVTSFAELTTVSLIIR